MVVGPLNATTVLHPVLCETLHTELNVVPPIQLIGSLNSRFKCDVECDVEDTTIYILNKGRYIYILNISQYIDIGIENPVTVGLNS